MSARLKPALYDAARAQPRDRMWRVDSASPIPSLPRFSAPCTQNRQRRTSPRSRNCCEKSIPIPKPPGAEAPAFDVTLSASRMAAEESRRSSQHSKATRERLSSRSQQEQPEPTSRESRLEPEWSGVARTSRGTHAAQGSQRQEESSPAKPLVPIPVVKTLKQRARHDDPGQSKSVNQSRHD